jgi:hypothetical protein
MDPNRSLSMHGGNVANAPDPDELKHEVLTGADDRWNKRRRHRKNTSAMLTEGLNFQNMWQKRMFRMSKRKQRNRRQS